MNRMARTAGALYIALFILGPFVFLFGKAAALAPGDPAASAANVLAMGMQFRVGMLVEVAIVLIEIVLAAIFYVIFRPVNQALSLAAAFARFGEALVQGVNVLVSGAVLLVLGADGALAAFTPSQLEALGHLLLGANAFGVLVWGVFFGFHLLLLGHLVRGSGFLPRWIGVLLMVAGVGYLVQSCGMIVRPDAKATLDVLVVVMAVPGELAFAAWLVTKGIEAGAADVRASRQENSR